LTIPFKTREKDLELVAEDNRRRPGGGSLGGVRALSNREGFPEG